MWTEFRYPIYVTSMDYIRRFFIDGKRPFLKMAPKPFETDRDSEKARLEKKVAGLEAKISKKNDVLSELMEEHVSLKKSLGEI